jgi:hypothetical protein
VIHGDTDDKRKEYSVRQDWRGRVILRVRTFENFVSSGQWMDARPKDLPEFFRRLIAGTQKP